MSDALLTCRLAAIPSCHVGVLVLTPLASFYILFVYQRLDAFLKERSGKMILKRIFSGFVTLSGSITSRVRKGARALSLKVPRG